VICYSTYILEDDVHVYLWIKDDCPLTDNANYLSEAIPPLANAVAPSIPPASMFPVTTLLKRINQPFQLNFVETILNEI